MVGDCLERDNLLAKDKGVYLQRADDCALECRRSIRRWQQVGCHLRQRNQQHHVFINDAVDNDWCHTAKKNNYRIGRA